MYSSICFRINEGGAEMIDRALNGYQRCAAIATHYRMNDVLDNIVISLGKFTTLTNSTESPYVFVPHFGANIKAMMATKAVFALAHKHGDILSDGWKNILDCLLWLFKCQLLSKHMVSYKYLFSSYVHLKISKKLSPPKNSDIFSTLF